MSRPITRNPLGVCLYMSLLASLLMGVTGCALFGYAAALGGEKIPAVFELDARPTLVLVDDPEGLLGSGGLVSMVGSSANMHLKNGRAIGDAATISQDELVQLAQRLGPEEYRRTPVDQIGRHLNASQVIHVTVEAVRLRRAPNVYQPQATVQVKVIDAERGERLFPDPQPFADTSAPQPGHGLLIRMNAVTPDADDRGVEGTVRRALAERIGQDVAQLFFDHRAPPPGHTLR